MEYADTRAVDSIAQGMETKASSDAVNFLQKEFYKLKDKVDQMCS